MTKKMQFYFLLNQLWRNDKEKEIRKIFCQNFGIVL